MNNVLKSLNKLNLKLAIFLYSICYLKKNSLTSVFCPSDKSCINEKLKVEVYFEDQSWYQSLKIRSDDDFLIKRITLVQDS